MFVATQSPTSAPTTGMAPTAPSPSPDVGTYVGCYELVQYSNGEFDWDNLYSDYEMTPAVSSPLATLCRLQQTCWTYKLDL